VTDWSAARSLLAVRLDSMGDVLMTTPALRALKTSAPGRRLTLLTSPAGAEVAPLIPELDGVVVYDAPWLKASRPRGDGRLDRRMIEELRARGFDGAVIFTVYSQNPAPSALLCHLADIPRRLAHCRENTYQLLTDWVPDPEPGKLRRHEVQRQLDLVTAIGCRTDDERLSLRVPEAARRRVDRLLDELGVEAARMVVCHAGASAPSRRYRAEGFAMVARGLTKRLARQVVFTGRGGEVGLVASIQAMAGVPTWSLVDRLDVGELAALIERASLLVANNTGPAHIAAAVGTPVVDLYALTNPQHTPWAVPSRVLSHDVPCGPCYRSVCPEGHHDCLRLVEPAAVVQAAADLLGDDAPAAATPSRSERESASETELCSR
jgi:lipopolysaccharide heptosyltransferase II